VLVVPRRPTPTSLLPLFASSCNRLSARAHDVFF
jgi:hypothetical protein